MTLLPTDIRVRRITSAALLLCLSLLLSYVETLFPIMLFIRIPGFKLGLANIVITAAFYFVSGKAAAAISFSRICLSSLLFGSVSSFMFSLSGGFFAFLGLIVCRYLLRDRVGWCGVSVLCAALHNIGQLFAAFYILGSFNVMFYLPWLLFIAIPAGALTGFLLCETVRRINYLKRSSLDAF